MPPSIHNAVQEQFPEEKQAPAKTTAAVPVGHAETTKSPSTDVARGGSLRGLAIGVLVCDCVVLICWILEWFLPVMVWVTLVAIVGASAVSFAARRTAARNHHLRSDVNEAGKAAFASHLVMLVAWIVAIILATAARSVANNVAYSESDEFVAYSESDELTRRYKELKAATLAMLIVTLMGLITAASFAATLLCKLNRLNAVQHASG